MADYTVKSFKELGKILEDIVNKKKKALEKEAINRTIEFAAKRITELVPIAFKELQDSVHIVDGTKVIVDAPHAAAVEVGSRPHTPPLEPLIKWVKLKGSQGLDQSGKIARQYKSKSTPENEWASRSSARIVARTIRAMRKKNAYTDVNIPEQIARSIQKAIMISGTKPSFFVARAIPDIKEKLAEEVRKALEEK